MELRHRMRAATLQFGRKNSDDPHAIAFWLCEGLKKRHVRGSKAQSLQSMLCEWEMEDVLNTPDLHFMNESSGIGTSMATTFVPRDEKMGDYIVDKDVIRICTTEELGKLLDKFARRDSQVDAELMAPSKSNTPLGAAISKLTKLGNTNSTIKMLRKTFQDPSSPLAEEAELLERFPEIDPVFENGEAEELPTETPQKCDMCDVSWPDDAAGKMYRLKKSGSVTHQGCTQFAADVLAKHPNIQTRDQIINQPNLSQVNRSGTFHVTVYRAIDLPGAQLLGTQMPYAKLSLLPWKEPQQTKPSETGGRHPLWKSMHDNVMHFSHMYNSTITPIPLLEVEIWNSNYLADDLIACTLLDMTPLLRYPNIEAKRWFTLSSRVQAPIAMMVHSTGQPKVLLSIKFVPLEGKYKAGNEHKFRVHQLKSVGLAIPNCAVCDRVIMNVIKGVWGYRCEFCGIDVHKGCIMKAMTKCECKSLSPPSFEDENSNGSEGIDIDGTKKQTKILTQTEHRGQIYRSLNGNSERRVGELFVNFQGLHLCSKQCQQSENFHAKNIFEGDTYCRLIFDDIIHETSPVLKSADPMYMETVCFGVSRRNSVFRIEVIDFTTDSCIGELKVTLFELLQRESDHFVRTNKLLNKVKIPLRRLDFNSKRRNDDLDNFPVLSNAERYVLTTPTSTSKSAASKTKKIGFALINLEFVEAKQDLLRIRVEDEMSLIERESRDVTVESLRLTFDRFNRIIKTFQWYDVEYGDIITWKNKRKSAVCLVTFVYLCVFMNLEYIGAYVMYGVLVYMMYQLHLRLEGSFVSRWIGYEEYDLEQSDRLKLHRPLADLHVAVHEARISDQTYRMLMESSSLLKDVTSSKVGFYVLIKYLPNEKRCSDTGNDTVFISSGYTETIVAWTNTVEKSRRPVWKKQSLLGLAAQQSMSLIAKQRKDYPFRNFNISWRHNPLVCACDKCRSYRFNQSSPSTKRGTNGTLLGESAVGIDHHAYYFPVPQARRKNFTGREDLVPWRLFPGLLQFDLCVSLQGDGKENPDLTIATGTIPLRDVQPKDNSTNEMLIPLTISSLLGHKAPSAAINNVCSSFSGSKTLASGESIAGDGDQLLVRVEFCAPIPKLKSRGSKIVIEHDQGIQSEALRTRGSVSRAERNLSEFVCESLVEKEKSTVLGSHLFDTFWKVKDSMKSLQNEIGQTCGKIACAENLLNWTHPWKTGAAFATVLVGAVIFSVIPNRWLVLLFGLSEFGAVFLEDLPPSNHFRNVLWNFLSSMPTDQDLIDAYEADREVYSKNLRAEKEREEEETVRLRHHALWAGTLLSKGDSDRSFKTFFGVYRPFRFLLWKSGEDADMGSQPSLQLTFEGMHAVVNSVDESSFVFQIHGVSSSGVEEKRSFSFGSLEKKDLLLNIICRSIEG